MDKNQVERENLLQRHTQEGHIQSILTSDRSSAIDQELRKYPQEEIDEDDDMKPNIRYSTMASNNMAASNKYPVNASSKSSTSAPSAPRSPIQKVGHLLASPGRAVARQVAPGSVKASVFSLITICLGVGTITIPYVFYENGIVLGIFFILFGGGLSMFTGHLIGYCAAYTGGTSFEDVAFKLYGKRGMQFTSFCNIVCNLGFLLANCVLFKTTMPKAIKGFHIESTPDWLVNKEVGEKLWLTIFCFGILFWISLPRDLGALRFTSLASFFIGLFIVLTIVALSFSSHVPDSNDQQFGKRLGTAITHFDITITGVFNSMPLIVFSYMYQPLIPAIYHELNDKSVKKMNNTLFLGTLIASLVYIMCGFFGYVTFAKHPKVKELMEKQNILDCYEDSLTIIKVCMIGVLTMVLFASPFCVLPSKDSFEMILMPEGQQFSKQKNMLCTFLIFLFVWALGLLLESLGQVMTILGATTNSGIGFLIPIVFYLKVMDIQEASQDDDAIESLKKEKKIKKSPNKCMRYTCYFVFVFVCAQSIISLVTFVLQEIND